MSGAILGHVVWHDLFTNDLDAAKSFYGALCGFDYVQEHATDFVWHDGEGDYCLIMAGGAAHGGMVAMEPTYRSHWTAYVAVDEVDQATDRAQKFGFTIDRTPFDIPGVGRSSVIRDTRDAQISPFVASHSYPPPSGVFVWEQLVTPAPAKAFEGLRAVFGWQKSETKDELETPRLELRTVDDAPVADLVNGAFLSDPRSAWIPYLGADNLKTATDKALSLGATQVETPFLPSGQSDGAILKDPTGALFGLKAS